MERERAAAGGEQPGRDCMCSLTLVRAWAYAQGSTKPFLSSRAPSFAWGAVCWGLGGLMAVSKPQHSPGAAAFVPFHHASTNAPFA